MVGGVAGGINYGSYGSKCLEDFETGRGGPRELSSGPAPEGTLLDLLDTLAALEQQVKAIRAALATAVLGAKEKRRAAVVACENTDQSDEPLVSVGWSLHRGPGPAATMPPPALLPSSPPDHRPHRGTEHQLKRRAQPEVLRSSGHPGRWRRRVHRRGGNSLPSPSAEGKST